MRVLTVLLVYSLIFARRFRTWNSVFSHAAQRGFGSLIETSAIVAIAAVVAVTTVSFKRSITTDSSKLSQTVTRMSTVMEAMDRYRSGHGRLPCPADPYLLNANKRASGAPSTLYLTGYGVENLDTKQDDGTLGVDCPINEGMVPINSLGLNDSFATDGWGNRFTYHISNTLCGTDSAAEKGCTANDYRNKKGIITVKDSSGKVLTTEAAYALVSHGPNGLGAFTPAGVKQKASTAANELENSNGDDVFVADSLIRNTKDASKTFDDIVRYKTKNQIDSITLDTTSRPMITTTACEDASKTLASLSLTQTNQLKVSVTTLPAALNQGDSGVVDILWTLQQVCTRYYGTGDKTDWKGPRCPGGATYDKDDQTCTCKNGSWSGSC